MEDAASKCDRCLRAIVSQAAVLTSSIQQCLEDDAMALHSDRVHSDVFEPSSPIALGARRWQEPASIDCELQC